MNVTKWTLLIVFVFFGHLPSEAQESSPFSEWNNRRVLKTAKNASRVGDIYNAINLYEHYLERKPGDINIRQKLGILYFKSRNYSMAKLQFNLLLQQTDKAHPVSKYYLARCYKTEGKYQKAAKLFDQFRDEYPRDAKDELRRLAKEEIEGCEVALIEDTSTIRANIEHLGYGINTGHIEGSPYWVDSNTLYFTALRSDSILNFSFSDTVSDNPTRKIYKASFHEREWIFEGEADLLPKGEQHYVSSFAISNETDKLYCSICTIRWNGEQVCHLYISEKFGDSYEPLKKLPGDINLKGFHSTHPTLAYDRQKGREYIYFASNREEGKGGWDIYYTYYKERRDIYKSVRNCGSKVNSKGDEMSPHYHHRTHKLYFSSNGHPGFGEYDVFKTVGERSRWSEPKNLGRTINSTYDDVFYTPVPEDPGKGIMASNRDGSIPLQHDHCCDDLFYFELQDYPRVYFLPTVLSQLEGEPIDTIEVTIVMRDEDGEKVLIMDEVFEERPIPPIFLEPGKTYEVYIRSEEYLAESDSFSLNLEPSIDTLKKTYRLEDLPSEEIVIPNIYYDFDDHKLRSESKTAIDTSILTLLLNNPRIQVEIGSHTDNKGTNWYNERLSQRRAESVVDYLIRNGVQEQRLIAKGYGESKPIAPNQHTDGTDNPEGRQLNRRTTFRIVGKLPYEVIYRDDDID